MNAQPTPPMPDRWWVIVPELSDAFQVEMAQSDGERGLWWGNQVVGGAVRRPAAPDRWEAVGRDGVPLPSDQAADGLYAMAEAALIQARNAWRRRAVTLSDLFGEDYWIEPRPNAGLASLWLGRMHLGYIRPRGDGTCEAFTTNDDPIMPAGPSGQRTYRTHEEGLLAVRDAWRTHLHRILRIGR